MKPRCILIPGNGGARTDFAWLPYAKRELEALGCEVIAPEVYPDPILARMSIWLPFIDSFKPDENTVLIGWSSGAEAAMRYVETHKILGTILVAPCYTDLGLDSEKESGYYDKPWNWEAIKSNQKWIVQASSVNDPHIPIEEARYVHEKLGTDYYEFPDKGHFYPMEEFPEIIEAIKKYI